MTITEIAEKCGISLNAAAMLLDRDSSIPEGMDVSDVAIAFNLSLNDASELMKKKEDCPHGYVEVSNDCEAQVHLEGVFAQ